MNLLSRDIDYFAEDDRTYPSTEDSAERGYVRLNQGTDPVSYENLGRAESLDNGDGDIADEGRGHRG